MSSFGYTFDLESYWIVSDLVLKGKSVYAETARYNYGPIWYLLLAVIRKITITTGADDIYRFHLIVAAFLTFIDAVTALAVRDRYGLSSSLFLFLNPVSILVTGYHSQFDNLAILLGLAACFQLAKANRDCLRNSMFAALLFGLSLSTKHILLFFPLWLWWLHRNSKFTIRLALPAFSYGLTAVFFLPFIFDESSMGGIIKNVVQYSSLHGNSLIFSLLGLFINVDSIEGTLGLALSSGLFLLLTIGTGGFWISLQNRRDATDLLFLYLMTLVCFTSSMAPQYLVIPLVALAIYKSVWSWIYSLAATLVLLATTCNILGEGFARLQIIQFPHAQIWLLILLFSIVWKHTQGPGSLVIPLERPAGRE